MQPDNQRDPFDDDLGLEELPEPRPLDADEESYTPDDDSDLGLATDDGDEEVGLDAEAGIDEPLDAELELDERDEGQRFSDGVEDAGDLEDDDDLMGGAEDGWTLDNEAAEDDDFGYEIGELDALPTGDAGEEGFADDAAGSDLALPEVRGGNTDDEEEAELDLPIDDLELDPPAPPADGGSRPGDS